MLSNFGHIGSKNRCYTSFTHLKTFHCHIYLNANAYWPELRLYLIHDHIQVTSHVQTRMIFFSLCLSLTFFTVRIFQTDSPSYPPPHLRHLAKSLPVPKGITPTLGWCVKGFRSATKQVTSLKLIWSDVE